MEILENYNLIMSKIFGLFTGVTGGFVYGPLESTEETLIRFESLCPNY